MEYSTVFDQKREILENHLKDGVNSYKSIFECNQDAIYAIDLRGYFVCLNTACENITGYSKEKLSKMKFMELITNDDLAKVLANFYQAIKGNFLNYDCKIINKNGDIVNVNVTNFPVVVDDDIVGVFGVAKDITEFKNKRQRLQEKEEIYRIITENSMDLISKTDENGNILYVSPSCEPLLGFKPAELIGQSILSLIHKDDIEKVIANHHAALDGNTQTQELYRIQKKDGSFIYLESLFKKLITSKKECEFLSLTRDVTERIRAEEERSNIDKAYRDLVEHSPDAVILVKDNKIIYINETGIRLLKGHDKVDFIAKKIFDFVLPEYHKVFENRIEQVKNQIPLDFIEQKICCLDGSVIEVEVRGIHYIFQSQTVVHLIFRDISERKKVQELLLNSEKLSIAGQFAAGIAHEIRNPLTSIKGFLQLLNEDNDKSDYFKIILSEVDRIEMILSEQLMLAKPQEMRFVKKDIKQLLQHIKTLIDTQAILNNIEIEIVPISDVPEMVCDENQLKQVFINFLKNSIEAMPNGGKITIEIEKQDQDMRLLFKDTGCGIPKEHITRIGQPFFTTKESGTGLGLMISKQIITAHNGSFRIMSDETGTTIEIKLPLYNEQIILM